MRADQGGDVALFDLRSLLAGVGGRFDRRLLANDLQWVKDPDLIHVAFGCSGHSAVFERMADAIERNFKGTLAIRSPVRFIKREQLVAPWSRIFIGAPREKRYASASAATNFDLDCQRFSFLHDRVARFDENLGV